MSFLRCASSNKFKPKTKHSKPNKPSLLDLFREPTPPQTFPIRPELQELQYLNRFAEELAMPIVSYEKIQILAWDGIPPCILLNYTGIRPKIWKFLLKYVLMNQEEKILQKKRSEYRKLLDNYWKPDSFTEPQLKIYHTIDADVKRIGTEYNAICKSPLIQTALKRLLFIWHHRHPASGYVQGMCDISIPFLIVFLGQYLPYEKQTVSFKYEIGDMAEGTLDAVQADLYWCVGKVIENVTENYTQGFNGVKQAHVKVQQYLQRIDKELFDHLAHEKVDLFAFSFRNISTMLLRFFNPNTGIRLFDTYLSYEGSFADFMVFLLIAILEKFAKKMLTLKFDELMGFVQALPTKTWSQADIKMVVAQAYVYQKIYTEKQLL